MNIEELALTEQEMKEDKSYAFLEFLSQATPTKKPEVTFVVAQPGAGKTGLSALSTLQIMQKNKATVPVNVNADRVAEYHRNYTKLLDYKPEDRFRVTRQFVNPTIKEIQQSLSENSVSMIIECTLNSNKKLKFMEELKKIGYKVNINVMVVDKLESRISCLEREVALLKFGQKARGIDIMNHDEAYNNMLKTIEFLVQQNYWDNIALFKRGEIQEQPEKIYEISEFKKIKGESIKNIINRERQKQRNNILKCPEKYLKRLEDIRNGINLYQTNSMLKEYTLKNIQELNLNFIKELDIVREI